MSSPRAPRARSHRAESSRRRLLVPVLIIACTLALVAAVLWIRPGQEDEQAAQTGAPSASDGAAAADAALDDTGAGGPHGPAPTELAAPDLSSEEGRDPDDLLAEGPVDAPVTIVVFTDYQCPYCARWSHETAPVLREYVERGELRIEWRDVNIYGEDSERAARATLAAAMQGEHISFHDRLFEDGEIRTGEELSEEALIGIAEDLGLDIEQFREDLDSEEVAQTVQDHAAQGLRLGAMSTPSFLVGGEPTVGAQPTEVFVEMVDEALAEAG